MGLSHCVIEPPWRILFVAAPRHCQCHRMAAEMLAERTMRPERILFQVDSDFDGHRDGDSDTGAPLDIVTIMSHLRVSALSCIVIRPATSTRMTDRRTMRRPSPGIKASDLIGSNLARPERSVPLDRAGGALSAPSAPSALSGRSGQVQAATHTSGRQVEPSRKCCAE